MTNSTEKVPLTTRIVEAFLRGDVVILLIVVSLVVGLVSLYLTPREEEPQIVVPLADVLVSAPGLSSAEVERKITSRLEKLLYQIDGVEYVYSMSKPGRSIVTVRFYVGEDRENSLVKLYNKIQQNVDRVPPAVTAWVVKPVEVDDVPIVNLTLWSDRPALYGDHQLRRLAEQLQNELQSIPDTNTVEIIGGRPRRIRVELDPVRLAARRMSALQIARALEAANVTVRAGDFEQQDEEFVVESGTFVRDARELQELVIGIADNRPGPSGGRGRRARRSGRGREPELDRLRTRRRQPPGGQRRGGFVGSGFVRHGCRRASCTRRSTLPWPRRRAVTPFGSARAVERRMDELSQTHLPDGVFWRITRDYGHTANEKVNELVESLAIAVITVVGLIGLVIGWRAALGRGPGHPRLLQHDVVREFAGRVHDKSGDAVRADPLAGPAGRRPDHRRGEHRPITSPCESCRRGSRCSGRSRRCGRALIMSTLAIIASFLPLVFITGMMGPYMAPMAFNVPLTVTISTVIAFVITPWLAMVSLGEDEPSRQRAGKAARSRPFDITARPLYRFSKVAVGALLDRRWLAWASLGVVGLLLAGAMALPALRVVPLMMLPYDNKNEFQIIVDMPEGTTLERIRRRLPPLGTVPGRRGRGARSATLRRHGLAHGLQRHGAALLPPPPGQPGRYPREPGAQAAPGATVARHAAADTQRPHQTGRRVGREHQAGRGPAPARR